MKGTHNRPTIKDMVSNMPTKTMSLGSHNGGRSLLIAPAPRARFGSIGVQVNLSKLFEAGHQREASPAHSLGLSICFFLARAVLYYPTYWLRRLVYAILLRIRGPLRLALRFVPIYGGIQIASATLAFSGGPGSVEHAVLWGLVSAVCGGIGWFFDFILEKIRP